MRSLALLTVALLGVRLASLAVVAQPGYTDAYYYATAASRLAHGDGLSVDLVWNYLEAPRFIAFPIPSHRFWMPLATVIQAIGIVPLGGAIGDFRAGQLAVVLIATFIPAVTYAAARVLGTTRSTSLIAAAIAGLGGAFAPAWVSVDAFVPAAVIGTLFFLLLQRAARGSLSGGIGAGLAVGLLYLARAEGALFGLALIWLAGRHTSRTAGVTGAAIALAIGGAWLVRSVALGLPGDLFARAFLLSRYDEFFAANSPTFASFISSPSDLLVARVSALATNAVTAAMSLLLVLVIPLVVAIRHRWGRADVRAFVGLALVIYLVQSLAFTLHSVRGSYFHSLAAFFPFAVALGAAGAQDLLPLARERFRRTISLAAVAAFAVVSFFAISEWDVNFNAPYRARLAALPLLPDGPLVVTDAAAWRWISGRPALLAPSEGPQFASCVAQVYLASTLVLEPAHFARYDDLYGAARDDFFTLRGESGGIRVYAPRDNVRCVFASQ